ncbi:MAG TPA: CoA ester lyase [Microbacteriaceae bacterium]|nr:CoA ester lyase [Microbacteriaceae bacterium]
MTVSVKAMPALLFCPADRPDRYQKALDRADGVILDLEDAVLQDAKSQAREAIIASDLPSSRVIVRINSPETGDFRADLAAVLQTKYRTIMVAKSESCDDIANIPSSFKVIALCETAKGVKEAEKIAELDNVIGLMWGAEDLIASMGGTSSRFSNGKYRDVARHARSRVLLAARAVRKTAIDAVHINIKDLDGLKEEASDAAASGFQATACIHPSQVDTIREAYMPNQEQIEQAKALLNAAQGQRGVFSFQNQMVDEPVLRHARSILARARRMEERSMR